MMLRHNLQPNVLLIICDQLRHDAVGYINPAIRTPNIDKLATESLVCTRAYTQSPQCQPARASLLTGRHVTAHRVWWNGYPLPLTERTFGNYLQEVGYQTAYFGKAHLVNRHNEDPDVIGKFGFGYAKLVAEWDLAVRGGSDAEQQAWNEYRDIMHKPFWTGRFTDREPHHDERVVDDAVRFIRRTKRPYLTVVSFLGPHPPYASPPPFCDLYDPKSMTAPAMSREMERTGYRMTKADWQFLKSQYYGSVSWIDDNIGRLLASVDPDAIVIFTSDHGDILGDHGYFSKGVYAYDGVVRVPLLIRAGTKAKYDGIVQMIDICPTLTDLVGRKTPPCIQGVSLRPALEQQVSVNDYALSVMGIGKQRVRMYADRKRKYWLDIHREFLFNLETDPGEENCLRDENSLNRYRRLLLHALLDADDPTPMPD